MGTKLSTKGSGGLPRNTALTAALALAMALTLSSCSGEDGKNGKDGTSCTLDGKVLTCGDKTLAIPDGEDGGAGDAGPKGDKGEPGAPCTMEQDGEGPAVITCGDKTVLIQTCGGEIYSPAGEVCHGKKGILYTIAKIGEQWWMTNDLKDDDDDDKFTWAQATAAGLCPSGWSLPSVEDFETLIEAGIGNLNINHAVIGLWSSEQHNESTAFYLEVAEEDINDSNKTSYFNVHCIKDYSNSTIYLYIPMMLEPIFDIASSEAAKRGFQ
jgi:hypothetical protein